VPSHTSVCSGRLRCWRCSVCSVFLRDPLTLILLFSQSFFLPLNLNLHSLTCLRRRLSMHLTLNPLGSLFELSQQKSVTRFPPDIWEAFFCRSLGAPIPKIFAHAHSRTLCSCKMYIDPLGDHVLTCKQNTGSIRGHNHLMDVVTSLSRGSKISPVRVNHKVSTMGMTLASRVTLTPLTSLSLSGMVL